MSNKETIISLKNIGKSFGSTRALESISFDFKRGDITAIVEPNDLPMFFKLIIVSLLLIIYLP